MKNLLILLLSIFLVSSAHAGVKTETVIYKEGEVELEGFVAYPDGDAIKRPAVLIIHDWTGLGDYPKARAEQLAELGYVAFAADIYGKGVRANNPGEAGKLAGKYKGDLPLYRARAQAALNEVLKREDVDADRVAAIGYCFGGTGVLEMARAGMPLVGVVSFHGGLSTTMPAEKGAIKAKVLVQHGADDTYVSTEEVAAFRSEMNAAGADWQFTEYSGAVHSFTNPASGNDNSKGAAYNESADKRSWEAMKAFFAEIFAK
jgi:dienelactone hydrolase